MIRFFRKLFKRGDFMTRADKAYYKYRAKTIFWSTFCLIIIAWVGTNLVLCALTTNVESNFDMIYEAVEPATLPSGKEFDCILRNIDESNIKEGSADRTIKNIVFDKFTNKEVDVYKDESGNNLIASAEKTTLNVDDEIYLYRANNGANVYVLSNRTMFANADSSYMFYALSSCEMVTFNNFKTDNVTNMSYMFAGGLSSWYDPGGSTQGLQTLDLSGWNTSKVTDMSFMFCCCGNLTTLNVNGWDTKNVTTMSCMFDSWTYDERKTVELDLSSFDTKNVTNMASMFSVFSEVGTMGGDHLTTIYVSERFVVDQVEYSGAMFDWCGKLTGQQGTAWTESNPADKTYARIDGGPNSATPGYFTYKAYSGK